MTQRDSWLPTSRHILNLLQHGENLINGNLNRNLSISLILVDNSTELLLREYLRYYKNRNPREVENLKFHELLAETSELQTINNHSREFQAFHDLRNIVYHTGALTPLDDDVISAVSFTKQLFNELHPEHQLSTKLQLPNEKTIEKLNEFSHGEYSELSLITQFAQKFETKGYDVKIESLIGSHHHADLILEKNNQLILCEFKKIAKNVGRRAFGQLVLLKTELEKQRSIEKITLWLIAQGNFSSELRETAKRIGITLIDDSNIDEFTSETAIHLYTDKSVVLYDSSFSIFTRVDKVEGKSILLTIKNKQGNTIHQSKLDVEDTNWISKTITTSGPEWALEGAEYKVIVQYNRNSASTTIWRSDFGTAVELDQKVYTWTDKALITIIAPDLNRDPNNVETIGSGIDSKVTISTSKGTLTNYKLVETEKDTGIFVGEIMLTGFPNYDANCEGKEKGPTGKTKGMGPYDGLLPCSNDDHIKVTLTTLSRTIDGSALIRWNMGEIAWDKKNYRIGDTGIITVVDPDVNLNSKLIDMFHVKVWSDSDPAGVKILVVETGNNTGIFVGDIQFGSKSSDYSQIKVSSGDSVSAIYVDKTLPKPYSLGESLEIGDVVTIES